jgi:hypothetical protein
MARRCPRLALRASQGQELAEMRSIETTETAFLIMAFFNVFFITDEAQNKVVLFRGDQSGEGTRTYHVTNHCPNLNLCSTRA